MVNVSFGHRARLHRIAAAMLASTALVAAACPALAQDATWLLNPGSGDFKTAANWTPATVPTGTAFFGVSNTTALSFSSTTAVVGGFTFNAGASAYTFTVGSGLGFSGAGIVINGGSATIINNDLVAFNATSTAGSATITNNNNAFVLFNATSTAGNAIITNNSGGTGGTLSFNDTSTAGNATITGT